MVIKYWNLIFMLDKLVQNSPGNDLGKSNYQTYMSFADNFTKAYQSGRLSTVVEFLEEFSKLCPLGRNLLVQAFSQLSSLGKIELANECARIHAQTSIQLIRESQNKLGLPPVYEFVALDACHVSVFDQAVFTKAMLSMGALEQKPILVLDGKSPLSEKVAFLPYLEEVYDLIEMAPETTMFNNILPICPYAPIFYSYSKTQYGHSRSFFYECNADLASRDISLYTFDLQQVTVSTAEAFLQANNYTLNEIFVVLYFSEDKAINNPQYQLNPYSYIEGIDYLINQGIQVIRIGSSKALPIPQRPGLIDLTQIERPKEVDIFLCGKAFFYLGSSSGPYSIAQNFGVPVAEIARFDYGGVRPRNFVQYLSFFESHSLKKYTFSDIKALGLNSAGSLSAFEASGILPDFPSSQQNLKFVVEALQYLDSNQTFQSKNSNTENYQKV